MLNEVLSLKEEYMECKHRTRKGTYRNSFMCSDCGKIFKTKGELTHHVNSKCGTIKLFVCKVCGQKLMTAGSLYNHMLRHSTEKSFMCRFCAKQFVTAGQLKVHERSHTREKAYVCETCGKGFCHRQSLITHSTLHTGIKPFQCEGCGNSFSCIGNLLKHRKTHADSCGIIPLTNHRVLNPSTKIKVKINTPETAKLKSLGKNKILNEVPKDQIGNVNDQRENECTNSGVSADVSANENCIDSYKEPVDCNITIFPPDADTETDISDDHLVRNVNQNSDFENREIICQNEREENLKNISDSLETAEINDNSNNDVSYTDEDVNKVTCKQSKLRKSGKKLDVVFCRKIMEFIKERKLGDQSQANCKYCGKKYTQFRCLYKHEQDHLQNDVSESKDSESKSLQFKCSCCKKCFASKTECRKHKQEFHADLLTCIDCDKIFANTDSLHSHQLIFHKGIPRKEYIYICEKCGRKFRQKSMLLLHNEKNCDNNLFRCNICQKHFSSAHTLRAHMRIHTSEKCLLCKFCGKSFHWKGQLKVHERSHTGEKPYTCLFCPRAFAYRDSLITHSSMHTGIKPHFCENCGWRFSCIGNLVKHRQTHASTCGAFYERNIKTDEN